MTETEKTLAELNPYIRYLAGAIYNTMHSYIHNSLDYEDLVQEGLIAAFKAISTYDPSKGAAYKTYAYIRIRGAMIDSIRKMGIFPKQYIQDNPGAIHSETMVELTGEELDDCNIESEVDYLLLCDYIAGIPGVHLSRFISKVEGHTGADIARASNLSESTISVSYNAIKKQIEHRLKQ